MIGIAKGYVGDMFFVCLFNEVKRFYLNLFRKAFRRRSEKASFLFDGSHHQIFCESLCLLKRQILNDNLVTHGIRVYKSIQVYYLILNIKTSIISERTYGCPDGHS